MVDSVLTDIWQFVTVQALNSSYPEETWTLWCPPSAGVNRINLLMLANALFIGNVKYMLPSPS